MRSNEASKAFQPGNIEFKKINYKALSFNRSIKSTTLLNYFTSSKTNNRTPD